MVALAPLATFADTTSDHAQAELANGYAQYTDAQQQVSDMQAQADLSATNERMIATLRSQVMREHQLNNTTNAMAMEQIANALAAADRNNGDLNALNELQIAQNHAAILIANVDGNLANAQMLATTRGRWDELANAQAQSSFLHQLADAITGTQATLKMNNARAVADHQADMIEAPAMAQAQSAEAMGANEVLAADAVLAASEVAGLSAEESEAIKADSILSHAASSLQSVKVKAAQP